MTFIEGQPARSHGTPTGLKTSHTTFWEAPCISSFPTTKPATVTCMSSEQLLLPAGSSCLVIKCNTVGDLSSN